MKNLKKYLLAAVLLLTIIIPTKVFAENYGEDFKKLLTDGKLVINSIPPKNEDESYYIIEELPFYDKNGNYKFEDFKGFFSIDDVSDDFKKITIEYIDKDDYHMIEKHTVDIVYNYDKNILKEVEKLVKELPREKEYYLIDDLEILNFWINGEADDYDSIDNYSTELKSYFKNKNLSLYVRNGLGFEGEFVQGRMGIASIRYNDTVYYVDPALSTRAYSIFYVDDDTTDVLKAIQKRINDYVGHDKYKVTKVGKVSEYIEDYKTDLTNYWHQLYDEEVARCLENHPNDIEICSDANSNYYYLVSFDDYLAYNNYTFDDIEELEILEDYENEYYYKMKIKGEERLFIVLKDSKKKKNPQYISSDLLTDVSISSKSTKVPLDSLVEAKQLTSGEEYNKIKDKLNYANGITFDLSLYSKSLQDYITKLDDTTFKVSIPIPAELNGKSLVVYYVANDGTVEEHEVTVEDGYATFITNHFSIYSLVDVNSINPDTGDNISLYITILLLSVMGLISIRCYKYNN